MSYHFSANQYDEAFRPKRMQQYTKCHDYQHQPNLREGETIIRSDDRGYLLPGVARSKDSPWGTHFVGTWDLPNSLPGPYALNKCARSAESQAHLREEKEAADLKIFGKEQPQKPPRVKPAMNDPIRRIVPHNRFCPDKNCSYFPNEEDNVIRCIPGIMSCSENNDQCQPAYQAEISSLNQSNAQSPAYSHTSNEIQSQTQPDNEGDNMQSPLPGTQQKSQSPFTTAGSKPQTPSTPIQYKPQTPSTPIQSKPQTPSTPNQYKTQTPSTPNQYKPQTPSTPNQYKPQTPSTPNQYKIQTPSTPNQ